MLSKLISSFYKAKYYSYNNETELCRIMDSSGSDKGPNFKNSGNYTKIYDYLFKDIKSTAQWIFEVGLGTNNTDVLSNMGEDGIPGASLRGWKKYFDIANVIGADIDSRILFTEDRISTYYVDQFDSNSIIELWQNFENIEFDIIIDDGIHDLYSNDSGNLNFFKQSIYKLKKDGYYIIEDVAFEPTGELINPFVSSFIQDLKNGKYGKTLDAEIVKIPAYLNSIESTHCTQMIIIKKS